MSDGGTQKSAHTGDFTVIATGMNVMAIPEAVVGTARVVRTPKDVLALSRSGDLSKTVVLTRGGAATFAGPLLLRKPAAVVTLEGAAESHLGILSREFSIPAVMSIELVGAEVERLSSAGQVRDEYVEHVLGLLDGRQVKLDCSDPAEGRVLSAGLAGGGGKQMETASPVSG